MHNVIETYLSNLEKRLSRKLPKAAAKEQLQEVRAHLTESYQGLVQEGKSDQDAALEALRRFGSDKLLAENLVRAEKGLPDLTGWRYVVVPSIVLAIGVYVPAMLINVRNRPPELANILFAWLPYAFALALGFVTLRARKQLIVPLFASFLLLLVPLIARECIWGLGGISEGSKRERSLIIADFDQQVKLAVQEQDMARSVRSGGVYPAEWIRRGAFRAPTLQTWKTARDSWITTDLESFADEATARRSWAQYGGQFIKVRKDRAAWARQSRNEWANHEVNWKTPLMMLGNLIPTTFPYMLVAIGYHLALLLILKLRDYTVGRRWRPEGLA